MWNMDSGILGSTENKSLFSCLSANWEGLNPPFPPSVLHEGYFCIVVFFKTMKLLRFKDENVACCDEKSVTFKVKGDKSAAALIWARRRLRRSGSSFPQLYRKQIPSKKKTD